MLYQSDFCAVRLWTLNSEFEGGPISFIECSLYLRRTKFWILESNLLGPIMALEKKELRYNTLCNKKYTRFISNAGREFSNIDFVI